MRTRDAVEYLEARFTCSVGNPGRTVDMGNRLDFRVYVTWRASFNLATTLWTDEDQVEGHLVSCCINQFGSIADKMERVGNKRPSLYWRYHDKIRYESDGVMARLGSRLYIVGCQDYGLYLQKDTALPHYLVPLAKPVKLLAAPIMEMS